MATVGITNTPTGGTLTTAPSVTGVVTIDPAGTLTGQFVGQLKNPDGSIDTIGRNLVSVTPASGLTTSSFAQTVTGTIDQTPVSGTGGQQATITTSTPLVGTSTPLTGIASAPSGLISTNLAITTTAMQPNAYPTAISPTVTANMVGAVAGPAGGVQTGVATIQAVTPAGPGTTITINLVGTDHLATRHAHRAGNADHGRKRGKPGGRGPRLRHPNGNGNDN